MKGILSTDYSERWNLKKNLNIKNSSPNPKRAGRGIQLLKELRKPDCLYAYRPFGNEGLYFLSLQEDRSSPSRRLLLHMHVL